MPSIWYILLSFLCLDCGIAILFYKNLNKRRLAKAILISTACAVFFETIVFNYDAFSTRNLEMTELNTNDNRSTKEAGECIIEDINIEVETITLSFHGGMQITDVTVEITDEGYEKKYTKANELHISAGSERYNSKTVRLKSGGKLKSIRIRWDNQEEVFLSSIVLNKPFEFCFNLIRVFFILLVLSFVILLSELYKSGLRWNPSSNKQKTMFALIGIAIIVSVFWVDSLVKPYDSEKFPYTQTIKYPFEKDIEEISTQTHAVMFDSLFHNGVVQVEPSNELINLSNPYDPSQRNIDDISYLSDYAFYKGKYYSYFGLTPVLVYYAPYYWIYGCLPSYTMAARFFSIIGIVGAVLCIYFFVEEFREKIRAATVYTLLPAAVLGSDILLLQSCADRYHLSLICMVGFFYLTILFALLTEKGRTKHIRLISVILCGLSTVLLVWSRPIGAIGAAGWVIPIFICVLRTKQNNNKWKWTLSATYVSILTAGALLIMYYNYIRFDNPFEFGQFWQLTIEDTHYNYVDIGNIFKAIYYYFIDMVEMNYHFPFFRIGKHFVNDTGNYFYGPASFGALAFPVVWGCFLLRTKTYKSKYEMAVYCGVLMTVVISLIDYCVAGVAQRYISDILPTLCLAGCYGYIKLEMRVCCSKDEHRVDYSPAMIIACIITITIACCFVLNNYRNFVMRYSPETYLYYLNLFGV